MNRIFLIIMWMNSTYSKCTFYAFASSCLVSTPLASNLSPLTSAATGAALGAAGASDFGLRGGKFTA
jgi:hypothetical protein